MESWSWEALLRAEAPVRERRDPMEEAVSQVLTIYHRERIELGSERLVGRRWIGALAVPADEALSQLRPAFAREGFTALVQQAERDEVAVVATPGLLQPPPSRLWLALALFFLTVVSTILTGAATAGPGGELRWDWGAGLMYSGTLLAILLAHELGHYLASRRLGVAVSYPFFIPLPLLGFGTMGAFIQMKEPPTDRRALFTIAVAGPLAGLALAIPLTLLGLSLSPVQPLPTSGEYMIEGNNLLYGAMKWLLFGEWLPGNGRDVMLHPIAWAGWVGLLVTAFNLLPAGQLDGGHVVFTLLGRRRAQFVTYVIVGLLLIFGISWNGWWLWAFLILALANRQAPLLNDVTALTPRQQVLAIFTLVLFLLLFTPTPFTLIQ